MLPDPVDDLNIAEPDFPIAQTGYDPSILTSIYEDNVNISIWARNRQLALDAYAKAWVDDYPLHAPRLLLSVSDMSKPLDELLPDLHHKSDFQQDIILLINMFACLFEVDEVGLRLTPLTKAMCPRFHVDHIPCRLVVSYGDLGTEWLLEGNVDRSCLGEGAKGLPDHSSGILQGTKAIQRLGAQQVALLKGSGWEGNEAFGLVHRSPHGSPEQSRLLLTLDFS